MNFINQGLPCYKMSSIIHVCSVCKVKIFSVKRAEIFLNCRDLSCFFNKNKISPRLSKSYVPEFPGQVEFRANPS